MQSYPRTDGIFNPTIPGTPHPPGKNRVKVEFAHGPHNLYLSIAVEIVLQGNLLYSKIIGTLKEVLSYH